MFDPKSFAGSTRRPARRTPPGSWGRGLPLLLERLDDRATPSVNIPLSGTAWTSVAPSPIAQQDPSDRTTSPGNLNSTGRIKGIAAHPTNPDIVYVAASGGGIQKTIDGGVTWTPLTDRIPGLADFDRANAYGSVALSKLDPEIVVAGQGEQSFSGDSYHGKGVLRSTDGGKNWTLIKGPGNAFQDVAIPNIEFYRDPADPTKEVGYLITSATTVYGRFKPNAMYRSDDSGVTWTRITGKLNSVTGINAGAALTDFDVDPTNVNVAYLAVGDPGGYSLNGVYKTTNALSANPDWVVAFGGNGTFIPGSRLGRIDIALAPTRPSTVYVTVSDVANDKLLGVYRSLESGINFRQFGNVPDFLPAQGSYNLDTIVSPTDPAELVLLGTLGKMVSITTDGTNPDPLAVQWSVISTDAAGEGPHVDGHALGWDASGRLLVGSDGGIFRADTLTGTGTGVTADWSSMAGPAGPKALNTTEVVGFALHPSSAETYIAGLQDNGILQFSDDGDVTNPNRAYATPDRDGGDGGDVVYDFFDPANVYHIAPVGSRGTAGYIRKSTDGGKTWVNAANGIVNPARSQFYPPIVIDPSNRNILYTVTDVLNQTTNGAGSWAQIGPNIPFVTGQVFNNGAPVTAGTIGVGRFDGNIIYVGVEDRVVNIGGNNVQFGPALYQLDLNVPPPFRVWIDVTPGALSPVLPPVTGAPQFPVPNDLAGRISDIAVDPFDSNIVYITVETDGGSGNIWRTSDGGSSWADLTGTAGAGALPARITFSVAIDPNLLAGPSDDDIYVGTEIGVYKLSDPTSTTPTWIRIGGESLPDVYVTDLEINTSIGILGAATYGRGVWELQIRPFISGYVFEDSNGNGLRDFQDVNGNGVRDVTEPFTESPLPGYTVLTRNLVTNAEQANTASRDPDGYWNFRSLPDDPASKDNYRIIQDLSRKVGVVQTTAPLPDFLDTTRITTVTDQNFGNFFLTAIKGTVFNDVNGNGLRDFADANGNGVQDAGEAFTDLGIPGRVVELFNSATGATLSSLISLPDGSYSFDNLGVLQVVNPLGAGFVVVPYGLREILPNGVIETVAPTGTITLTSGTPNLGNDFGNFTVFSITGMKFEDLNGNGTLDPGEPGLRNWTFRLLDGTGADILGPGGVPVTDVTDSKGVYSFTNLAPIRGAAPNSIIPYRVREVLQPGWQQVTANPPDVFPQSGQTLQGGDFGNFKLVTVTGTVFDDTNGDGVQTIDEISPVGGGIVHLVNVAAGVDISTTVAADGTYAFPDVRPVLVGGVVQPFSVFLAPPAGYIQTTTDPAPFTVTSGNGVVGLAFGVFKLTSISGLVYHDINGNGIQDAAEPNGLGVTGGSVNLLNAQSGAVIAALPIGLNGLYSFTNLSPIRGPSAVIPYRVLFNPPPGWTFTPVNVTGDIFLRSGQPVGPLNFGGFRLTSINGTVFDDLNGDGVRQAPETGGATGATVRLVDTRNGSTISTLTVAADGTFSFPNLGPLLTSGVNSPYRIIATPATGWQSTGVTQGDFVLFSGTPVTGQLYPEFKKITISGNVFEDLNFSGSFQVGEPGLTGWTIRLTNTATGATQSAVSNAAGNYSFADLGPGVYQLREDGMPNWVQLTPNPADLPAVSGKNSLGNLFGNFQRIAVSGRVIEDLNRDGVLQSTEPGSPDWVVSLIDAASGAVVRTLVTDAAGNYSFAGVDPGRYDLRITPRTSWIATTGNPGTVTTVSSRASVGNNFGVLRLGSYTGYVFADNNRNGVQDPFENRLPGVDVILRNTADVIVTRQTTAADGTFAFYNLEPGQYKVSFIYGVAGAGFILTNTAIGTNGIPITITSGSNTSANGLTRPLLGIANTPYTVIGADAGGGPHVQVFNDLTSQIDRSFYAYDASFTGGVRVAQGDVNGDGVADIITAVGPGGGPNVRAFDGITGNLLFSFFAYEPSFTGGLFIAAGDVNGDGIADIITGTDVGGGPRVQVFDGKTRASIQNYFAYESTFRGGVRVAAGDVNGDGVIDIVTTPAVGGGPRVSVRSGVDGSVLSNFFAFDPNYLGGLYVAAGDLNGDNVAEIIVGQGAADNPLVRTFTAAGVQLASGPAFPGDEFGNKFASEVRVAVTDRFGDGKNDIVVTSGPGSITRLRFLDSQLRPSADEQRPYADDFTGGVFVG